MKFHQLLSCAILATACVAPILAMEQRNTLAQAAQTGNLPLFLALLGQNGASASEFKDMAQGQVKTYLNGQFSPETIAAFKAKGQKLLAGSRPAPRPTPAPVAKPAQKQAPAAPVAPAMGKLSPASRQSNNTPVAPRPAQPRAVQAPAQVRPTLPPLSPASRNQNAGTQADQVRQECPICVDEKPVSQFVRLHCGHQFCRDCLNSMLAIDIRERTTADLKCPNMDCREKLSAQDIAHINRDRAQEVDDIQFQESLRSNPNIIACPTTDCKGGSFKEANDHGVVRCTECHKDFCLDCKLQHSDRVTCAHAREMQQIASNQNQAERASNAWKQQHTKECPRCKTVIQKTEGCNHMTCRQCRYEFCWLCQRQYGSCRCPLYGGDVQPAQAHAGNVRAVNPAANPEYMAGAHAVNQALWEYPFINPLAFQNILTYIRADDGEEIFTVNGHRVDRVIYERLRNQMHQR